MAVACHATLDASLLCWVPYLRIYCGNPFLKRCLSALRSYSAVVNKKNNNNKKAETKKNMRQHQNVANLHLGDTCLGQLNCDLDRVKFKTDC